MATQTGGDLRGLGCLSEFDVNHRSALWRGGRDPAPAYRKLAAQADIVFVGDDEAVFLTGETDPDRRRAAIRGLGPRTAVIKLGDEGALAADGAEVSPSSAETFLTQTITASCNVQRSCCVC